MTDSNDDYSDEIWEYYDKIRDALQGLFDVLNIALDPDSAYYQWGVDNLEALKNNLIELLMKDYDTLELQDTLRRIEFNLKKSLFFNDSGKKEQNKERNEEKTT